MWKLLGVVNVANVDAKEHGDDSDFEPEFLRRYQRWRLVKILMQIFGQDFQAYIKSRFKSWILVTTCGLKFVFKILKLISTLNNDSQSVPKI